jgi:hypothetical protein
MPATIRQKRFIMQKVPSLFKRDYEGTRLVYDEIVDGCEWVLNGEGVATVKIDGTSCMVKDGMLYKRYDAKQGKPAPEGFIAAQEPDPKTGHWPGWLEVGNGNEDKWHQEAWIAAKSALPDGTYELIGAKVQGNPYKITGHKLVTHGAEVVDDVPRDFDGLKAWFADHEIEGIVWHHPDGRMCKIKRKDFGYKWPE